MSEVHPKILKNNMTMRISNAHGMINLSWDFMNKIFIMPGICHFRIILTITDNDNAATLIPSKTWT